MGVMPSGTGVLHAAAAAAGNQANGIYRFTNNAWARALVLPAGAQAPVQVALRPTAVVCASYGLENSAGKTMGVACTGSPTTVATPPTSFFSGHTEVRVILDVALRPVIAFSDPETSRLVVLGYGGSAWAAKGPRYATEGEVTSPVIAVDSTGAIVAAYSDTSAQGKLAVLRLASGGQTWTALGSEGLSTGAASQISLAVNPSTGNPVVVLLQPRPKQRGCVITVWTAGMGRISME